MSVSFHAYLVVGIRVTRADFFKMETDTEATCPKGHKPEKAGVKFCPECGGKFEIRTREVPTEALRKYAKKFGCKALVAYEGLREAYYLGQLGLFQIEGCHSESDGTYMAFGYRIREISPSNGDDHIQGISLKDLQEQILVVRKEAGDIGLPSQEAEVFFTGYAG
jgi:predicted RNA-binding Zn-ribbon protein involved in translation (DUF1610 family)